MPTISKDNPCLFVTTVAHNRLPVFRTDALKAVACRALDEARRSGGFALFAYVVMPEHLHVLPTEHSGLPTLCVISTGF